MTNFTPINFTLAKDSKTIVTADRYVAHDLYVRNKAIVESLGGTVLKGVGGFKAEFPKVAIAKKFIAQAITSVSEDEYKANRKPKVEEAKPQAKESKSADKQVKESKPKTDSKGNKKSNARKGKGNDAPTKAATEEKVEVKEVQKPKTKAELTPSAQKALDKMKMSVLNRAASAYSIANGGAATTFVALGKSADELAAFMPKAKMGLLKSPKWAKASATHGLTEDMLG